MPDTDKITEAAVEAVAAFWWSCESGENAGAPCPNEGDHALGNEVLMAVEPLLRAKIADQIDAIPARGEFTYREGYIDALGSAARIAEGGNQ